MNTAQREFGMKIMMEKMKKEVAKYKKVYGKSGTTNFKRSGDIKTIGEQYRYYANSKPQPWDED